MRSSTSLLGRVLFWIASEMLEILNKIFTIISNYNLFPCLLCDPWIIYWSTIKKGKRRFILYFTRFALPLTCDRRYFRSEIKINACLFCIPLTYSYL